MNTEKKEALKAALLFLARTQLGGQEVDAFVTVVRVIKELIDEDDEDAEKATTP